MAGPRRRSVHRHLSLPLPVTGLATGIPVPRLRQLPDASGRSARPTSRLPSQHPWRSAGLRGVRRPGSCRYRLSSSRWPSRPRRLRSPGIRGLRVGPGAQAVNHPAAAAVHRGDPRRLLRVPARQSQGDVHPLAGSDDDPRHHLCLGYHLLLRPAWRFLALLLLHQPTRHDRPGEAVVVLVRPLRPVRCQQHLDDVRLLDSHRSAHRDRLTHHPGSQGIPERRVATDQAARVGTHRPGSHHPAHLHCRLGGSHRGLSRPLPRSPHPRPRR